MHRRRNLNGALWAEIELHSGEHVLVFPKAFARGRDLLAEGVELEITARSHDGALFAHEITKGRC